MILKVLRHEVSICNVYIKTSFKPLLRGGGGLNPLVKVTVNSKKENSGAYCHNYVQEFVLRIHSI
jgi:hypothetical protein